MKAILIDVKKRDIREVEVSGLQDWYKEIGCELVTTALNLNESDSIMVDDEGLFFIDNDSSFFSVKGGHQPFIGNGLVVGCEDNGESTEPCVTVDDLKKIIKFHSLYEVESLFCRH